MEPLKIFWNLKEWLHAAEARVHEDDDPFHDPDVMSMNERELADLPFPSIYHADPDIGARTRECA